MKPSATSAAVPSAKVIMSNEENNYGRDYLYGYYQKPKKNFTAGISKDGIEFTTAQFSINHLEVSFKNGTIHIYDTNNLYWAWYYQDYYYNHYNSSSDNNTYWTSNSSNSSSFNSTFKVNSFISSPDAKVGKVLKQVPSPAAPPVIKNLAGKRGQSAKS